MRVRGERCRNQNNVRFVGASLGAPRSGGIVEREASSIKPSTYRSSSTSEKRTHRPMCTGVTRWSLISSYKVVRPIPSSRAASCAETSNGRVGARPLVLAFVAVDVASSMTVYGMRVGGRWNGW